MSLDLSLPTGLKHSIESINDVQFIVHDSKNVSTDAQGILSFNYQTGVIQMISF